MKMPTPKITIAITLVFVAAVVTTVGILWPSAQTPSPDPVPQEPAISQTRAPSPAPLAQNPASMPIACAQPMEEFRSRPTIEPGTAIQVVSLVPGRIQILNETDQVLAESAGQTPWIRCKAARSQTLYKVNFQPADGRIGLQRVFPLTLGHAHSYVQISADPKAPAKTIVKQQATPFS